MTGWIEPIALWLADFYLAATILLVVVAGVFVVVKQPARRMAVGWGTLVSLLIVAVLCQSSSRPRLNLRRLLSNHDGKATEIATSQASLQVAPLIKKRAPTDVDESEDFEPPQVSVEPLAATGSPSVASAAQEPSAVAWGELIVAGAVWGYLIGTLLMTVRLSIGVLRVLRLVRQSTPAAGTCVDELQALAGPAGRPPRLCVHRSLRMPVATGTLRPVILLPEEFTQSGRPQELKAVLAHEWAHIKNGDLWLLALDRIVLPVLWAHPLYWWTRRRLRMDREFLADAAAAAQMGAADYAALLVEWARKVTCPGRAAVSTAIGVWERPGGLAQRVAALLNQSDRTVVRTSGRTRIGVAVAIALVGLFAAMISLRPPRAELAQAQSRPSASSQPAKATEERPGLNDVGGMCRDKDGKPLVGVQMSLYAVQEATGRQQLLRQGTTDGRGRFHFSQCLGKGIVRSLGQFSTKTEHTSSSSPVAKVWRPASSRSPNKGSRPISR
jgi:beta-lactamase regulating signal transducer with metallopeptidase domain